jgi:hypothetical protein
MQKIKTILFILTLFSVINSSAQGIELGIKIGTDIQKIAGASFGDKFAFGYHYGGFALLKLTSSFGFQPEIYYSTVNLDTANGFSAIYGSANASKLRFAYIHVPLLLNFRFNKRLSIQLGPKFSMLTNKNSSVFGNSSTVIKTGEMSGVIGVQANILRFKFYGRYQFGLSNLNNLSEVANAIASKEKWKNQVIHLGVGLRFL